MLNKISVHILSPPIKLRSCKFQQQMLMYDSYFVQLGGRPPVRSAYTSISAVLAIVSIMVQEEA